MRVRSTPLPRIAARSALGFILLFSTACLDPDTSSDEPFAPQFSVPGQQGLDRALAVQQRHTAALMRLPGVVGTAVGLNPAGRPIIRVFATGPAAPSLPATLDGVPVAVEVTGLFVARQSTTQRVRPAPLGFSVGHPLITAGSIGARVVDVFGDVHILSNNHVLAAMNQGSIGDGILQPGAYDGGTLPGDQVGTLSAFQPINFNGGNNLMDAALARTTRAEVDNSTVAGGYGTPSSSIWGDGDGDGLIDNRNALLGLNVLKYGRTTGQTAGQVTGVNGTVSVCYDAILWICLQAATFVDQVIIEPGTFSDGGDSGSLIVSQIGYLPVGLLFAGSTTQTIANRIDLVLDQFNVSIDAGPSPPPTPVLDLEVTGVSAPALATEGDVVDVVVSVRNIGNQDAGSFTIALNDLTDSNLIGTLAVSSLGAGQTISRTFSWNTTGASTGEHTLRGSHSLTDDNASNDAATTTIQVNEQGALLGIHVGDLDGWNFSGGGNPWDAVAEVYIHDANHQPVDGATVVGRWTPASALASDTCVTGELGGIGSCIFLSLSNRRRRVTFEIVSVTLAGETYVPSANHDPDGDSDGTTVVINR